MTPEQAEARTALDIEWLLGDERGRRIARTLVRWSGLGDTGPLEGVEAMARATGARQLGNVFARLLEKHCPEGWLACVREEIQDRAEQMRLEEERARQQHLDLP
jgi:hypothetical protein